LPGAPRSSQFYYRAYPQKAAHTPDFAQYKTIVLIILWAKVGCKNTVQITAFRCWSNSTSTDGTFSTVPGRSSRWDSMIPTATFGWAMSCCISWLTIADTSWGLNCDVVRLAIRGTGLNIASLWLPVRPASIWCARMVTRATLSTRSAATMEQCLPLSTVTTMTMLLRTAPSQLEAGSGGTTGVGTVASTPRWVQDSTSAGLPPPARTQLTITFWWQAECGWLANRLNGSEVCGPSFLWIYDNLYLPIAMVVYKKDNIN